MKLLTYPFLILIRGWQKFIAPGLAPRCKYYPSCSHYTFEAIQKYNLFGLLLGAWRVVRCNPFSYGGVDYVPEKIHFGPIRLGAR
ncbi:MAG: membrane protein insertion efficiency factor YidD [Actinomycetota bacterium]